MAFHRLPRPLLEAQLWIRSSSLYRPPIHAARFSSAPARLQESIRLRFAPSPTGYLHLGGLRTALYNHLLARNLGGTWTLRIEDTDQNRFVDGAVESLLRILKWAKLDFDEGPGQDRGRGPYHQSQRKHIYDKHIDKLIESGKAYHCFCSPERLSDTRKALQKSGSNATYDRRCLGTGSAEAARRSAAGDKSVVRFKSTAQSLDQEDLVYDTIHYPTLPSEDFVLRKSDGLPTYHFANVVDDHEMGITHVLRGEEWLPSTPKHLALYEALGWEPPKFAHLPLLINPDGSKLSKRAGDVRVEDYIEKGYEPEALLNFVALMGWSPSAAEGPESEVFAFSGLIKEFSLDNINKNRATMSTAKLDYLNRAHVQLKLEPGNEIGREEVALRAQRFILEKFVMHDGALDLQYIARVVSALKERIHTVKDVVTLGACFFSDPDLESPTAVTLLRSVSVDAYVYALEHSVAIVDDLPDAAFEEAAHDELWAALSPLIGQGPLKSTKDLMNPLRHALTGQKVGAGVPATIGVLGRQETVSRLRAALARIVQVAET